MEFHLDPAVSVFAIIAVTCLVALGASLWLKFPGLPRQVFGPVDLGVSGLYRMTVQNMPGRTGVETGSVEPENPDRRPRRNKPESLVSRTETDSVGEEPRASADEQRTNTSG